MRTFFNPIAAAMLSVTLFAAALPVFADSPPKSPGRAAAVSVAAPSANPLSEIAFANAQPSNTFDTLVKSDTASRIDRADAHIDNDLNRVHVRRHLIKILSNNGLPSTAHEEVAALSRKFPKLRHRA